MLSEVTLGNRLPFPLAGCVPDFSQADKHAEQPGHAGGHPGLLREVCAPGGTEEPAGGHGQPTDCCCF